MSGDFECLSGGGQAGAILRAVDWTASPLGSPQGWPEELKAAVRSVLASEAPMMVSWGADEILFYNDGHAPQLGARHPGALGHPAHAWKTQMREAQAQLELTLANSEIIGLWDWRIPEDRVYADRRFAELYGVEPERAAEGAPIAEFVAGVHPDDRDMVTEAITGAMKTGETFESEYRLQDSNGAVRHVLARGQPKKGPNREWLALAGVTIDITKQREAEIARLRSETRYGAMFNSIEVGFCIFEMEFDAAGVATDYLFLEVNPAFERHTGLKDAVGRRARQMVPGLEQAWFDIYGRVATTGESHRFEMQAGEMGSRWFGVHAQKVGGTKSQVALIFSDISDAKMAEQKLQASETQFRLFAQAMPNHVWTSPPDGQLDWFNERTYAYAGAAPGELDGAGWTAIVHPEDVLNAGQRWATALASGEVYETEFRLRRADGAYRWHIARAVPIKTDDMEVTRWIGTNTDIEDQKAAAKALADINVTLEAHVQTRTRELMATEEQLRQSQKMEAIGQLTGGIAHDFNNLMQGIIAALSLVRRRMDKAPRAEIEKFMDAAVASAQRAASLTHRLLAFSRQQSLDVKAVDVLASVEGLRDLVDQTLGEDIGFEIVVGTGTGAGSSAGSSERLWPAQTDANQFENALLNLAINARDAMPDGGQLTIAIANRVMAAGPELAAGEYVSIRVSDTGEGMTPEVMAKAFDPFFTTKPIGQGTGLGLSMIYGFARQSGGHVRIESAVGRGTTVEMLLPRAGEAARGPAAKAAVNLRGAGETVLVVEDDPTVRLMVISALTEWGYEAIEAASAPGAIPVLRSERRIDLLLTDVGLPSITGRQLADIARQFRPGLKVLFMTGYAEKAAARSGFLEAGMDLLTKPFELDVLGVKIRQMLEG